MFNKKKQQHSIAYSQNFFVNIPLANTLVCQAGIRRDDTIIEIGPGHGVLTKILAAKAGHVIAIEKDHVLIDKLKKTFQNFENVKIIEQDFLQFELNNKPYSVFANPPFNITSQIIKKLLQGEVTPESIHIFSQKEAAERFCGIKHEYQLSIQTKPWFQYEVMYRFSPNDFSPRPAIDIVLLGIHKLDQPLLAVAEKKRFEQFVQYGFSQQRAHLRANFKNIFTHEQWKRITKYNHFTLNAQPTDIGVVVWVNMYKIFNQLVESSKQLKILSLRRPA